MRPKVNTLSPLGTRKLSIGMRLQEARDAKGFQQSAVAKLLGYTKGYISSIENGRTPIPRGDFIQRYGEAIGLSPEEIEILLQSLNNAELAGEQQPCNVPYQRSDFFVGREDIIRDIHDALTSSSHICAITGLSGIGKTTVVVEYAHRYRDMYQGGVLWVDDASSSEILYANFAQLATDPLDLPEKSAKDQRATISIIKRWLQEQSDCLLVFDSFDEALLKDDFLSQLGNNHIILTMRSQPLEAIIPCI